jgi:hypothetical protein
MAIEEAARSRDEEIRNLEKQMKKMKSEMNWFLEDKGGLTDISEAAAGAAAILAQGEAPSGAAWSIADVVEGTERWITEVVLKYGICPMARAELDIVVSTRTRVPDAATGGPAEWFTGIDMVLVQEHARLLLADPTPNKSVMFVFPYVPELDNCSVTNSLADATFGVELSRKSKQQGGSTEEQRREAEEWNERSAEREFERTMKLNNYFNRYIPESKFKIIEFFPALWFNWNYLAMPWYTLQIFRLEDLTGAADEWFRMQGTTEEKYMESVQDRSKSCPRMLARKEAYEAAAPEITDLLVDVRRGRLPTDAPREEQWRQREVLRREKTPEGVKRKNTVYLRSGK